MNLVRRGFTALVCAFSLNVLVQETHPTNEANQVAESVKKLQYPIAGLISVRIRNNWDFGIGPMESMHYIAKVQPVIPFLIGENWNRSSLTLQRNIRHSASTPKQVTNGMASTG